MIRTILGFLRLIISIDQLLYIYKPPIVVHVPEYKVMSVKIMVGTKFDSQNIKNH